MNTEYVNAIMGGFLIAMSITTNFLMNGQLLGFSSIKQGLLFKDHNFQYKMTIIVSILFFNSVIFLIGNSPNSLTYNYYETPKQLTSYTNIIGTTIGGFCIGFGAAIGNGCTSGHGICGTARLSIRSIVFVILLMTFGFGTANLQHYVRNQQEVPYSNYFNGTIENLSTVYWLILAQAFIYLILNLVNLYIAKKNNVLNQIFVTTIIGFLFSAGIIVSGFNKPSKIFNFLVIKKGWDGSMLLIMGVSIGIFSIFFRVLEGNMKKPIFEEIFMVPTNRVIDWRLIIGGIIFGIGMGLSYLCPAPYLHQF